MARRIRYIPLNSLVEVTCRTVQGRLLLRPSPVLCDLILGVLARAARLYPVEVHAFVFLSNHYHLLLSVADAQRLASFMRYLNSNLARKAGRLIRWRERFWGRRYQAILVSDEAEVQAARLRYILSHGCKEGLVRTPAEWPGAHCVHALLAGSTITGRWVDGTLEYQARRRGVLLPLHEVTEVEQLTLAPLPRWNHLSAAAYQQEIQALVRGIELEADRRERSTGRQPAGREFIESQNPHQEPNRMKRGPAPLVHAFATHVRRNIRNAYRDFVAAYRHAAERLRAGDLLAEFPCGAFPPSLPFQPQAPPG